MKKFTKICAAALAVVCAAGLAGCSSSSGSSSSLSSKWYVRTNYLGIQPSVAEDGEYEQLTYDISFTAPSSTSNTYSISYNLDDGASKLVTRFYSVEYSWNDSSIPEGYRSSETETVYCYEYAFALSGAYTFISTGETSDFDDEIVSVCYFRSVRNNLQPVCSYQYVRSTSPANYSPSEASDMFKKVEYEYFVYYNKDCTEATTYYDNKLDSTKSAAKTIDLSESENMLFDNGSVYTVMRAMNITSSLSMDIDIFIPAESGYTTYNVTGSDSAELGEDDQTIKDALVNAGYVAEEDAVNYSSASLSYTGDLSGTSQTIWYASLSDDTDSNYCRSTMLKIILPISFGLGTLEFSLSEVNSHFTTV